MWSAKAWCWTTSPTTKPGLGLEHLIYVIGEDDLPIDHNTYDTIAAASDLLEIDPSGQRGIDPRQDPVDTVHALSKIARESFTVAVKLLDDGGIDQEHKGPLPGTHLAELRGEAARPLLDLVERLKTAGQARCHTPRYSLVFWGPNRPVAEAALCFRCNSGRTRVGSTLGWIQFNGKASAAVELLDWLKLIESESGI